MVKKPKKTLVTIKTYIRKTHESTVKTNKKPWKTTKRPNKNREYPIKTVKNITSKNIVNDGCVKIIAIVAMVTFVQKHQNLGGIPILDSWKNLDASTLYLCYASESSNEKYFRWLEKRLAQTKLCAATLLLLTLTKKKKTASLEVLTATK